MFAYEKNNFSCINAVLDSAIGHRPQKHIAEGRVSTGTASEKPESRNEPRDMYVLVTKNNKGTTKKQTKPPPPQIRKMY